MSLAQCLADGLSLRESAARCRVSLRTAWFMRHRACEVMASRIEPFRPVGEAQVDGKYFAESLARNHSRPAGHDGAGTFGMPRARHRSGGDVHRRGLSNLQTCVVTGINELGDEFAGVRCRDQAGEAEPLPALRGRAGEGATVKADGKRQYAAVAAALGAAHVAVGAKGRTADDINVVNSMHSRLRHFMDRFHGAATRHPQHYLDWFCYREQFRKSDGDARERMYRHEREGRYRTTRSGYVGMPMAFPEYWEAGGVTDRVRPMSTLV